MSSKVDKHQILQALHEFARELGRTPSRDEFAARVRNGKRIVNGHFGNWRNFLVAAGLAMPDSELHYRQPGNEIFRADLPEVLEAHKPLTSAESPKYKKILVIGDTHFPFVHQPTLEKIYRNCADDIPDMIIQLGDLYDMYAHSKFPRSLNIYIPAQEEELGRQGAETMWKTLRGIAPNATCVQLKGNHDIRMLKRTLELQPALEHAVGEYLNKLMTFEGVELVTDSRQEYIVDGIQFLHGYRSQLGAHRDYALMNSVCGHIHTGGTVFRQIRGQILWELNAGYVGDPTSKALGYTPQKISNHTLGFGRIDSLGPRFIPC